MTQQKDFYDELEDFAQEHQAASDKQERPPGCLLFVIIPALLGVFLFLPWWMVDLGREIVDFRSCEQATMGRVISVQTERYKKEDHVAILYTPPGGDELVFVQKTKKGMHYSPGASVKVRYREGQAFIDNGLEDKHHNVLWMVAMLVFWGVMTCYLALFLYAFVFRKPWQLLRCRFRSFHRLPS